MIGIDQLEQANSEGESVFDALQLEIQRSLDYFESFYGMGTVTRLRLFPQIPVTEKMAMYLQDFSNFDIEFLGFASADGGPGRDLLTSGDSDGVSLLEQHCFHAYCAALRGLSL
jgi:hypothetical protein